jgi:hypothetical protein
MTPTTAVMIEGRWAGKGVVAEVKTNVCSITVDDEFCSPRGKP